MNKTTTWLWVVVVGFSVASVGCAIEDEDAVGDGAAEDTSSTIHALSGVGITSLVDDEFRKAAIGTATNRACFLSGVGGWLTTSTFPTGTSQGGVAVTINAATNQWEISVSPTVSGAVLKAWAQCMSTTSLTAEVTWRSDQPRAIVAPVVSGRRCFFTRLRSGRDNTLSHGGFSSTLDQVYIANDGANWYIDGDQSGLIWASARCVTITTDVTTPFNWANPGSSNKVIATSAANNDTVCLLTQVGGRIANTTDSEAGPHVTKNPSTLDYEFIAKDGNGGRVKCVR